MSKEKSKESPDTLTKMDIYIIGKKPNPFKKRTRKLKGLGNSFGKNFVIVDPEAIKRIAEENN